MKNTNIGSTGIMHKSQPRRAPQPMPQPAQPAPAPDNGNGLGGQQK